VSSRERYVVIEGDTAGPNAGALCGAIFDALDKPVTSARVDAYSDYADQMPDDIRAAEEWLRSKGFARGTGDPGIGIVVDAADETGWAIVRAYAPWAVRTSLFDGADQCLAILDDGGQSITVELDSTQADVLAASIAPTHSLVALSMEAHTHDA
jgi:hypothetical protein